MPCTGTPCSCVPLVVVFFFCRLTGIDTPTCRSCPALGDLHVRLCQPCGACGVSRARGHRLCSRTPVFLFLLWLLVCSPLFCAHATTRSNLNAGCVWVGLKKFPECVDFALEYIDFLWHQNDSEHLKVTFERILKSLPARVRLPRPPFRVVYVVLRGVFRGACLCFRLSVTASRRVHWRVAAPGCLY